MWTEAPVVYCPNCAKEFDDYAYFERNLDSELTCKHCSATLQLEDDEAVRHWTWKVKEIDDKVTSFPELKDSSYGWKISDVGKFPPVITEVEKEDDDDNYYAYSPGDEPD